MPVFMFIVQFFFLFKENLALEVCNKQRTLKWYMIGQYTPFLFLL